MSHRILLSLVVAGTLGILTPAAARAQTHTTDPDAVKMFHPAPPLPSYEVATIKKADPIVSSARRVDSGPTTSHIRSQTIKSYILSAYGAARSEQQIVGGPAWISADSYAIQGKIPDNLRDAMQKMTPAERDSQERMMQQSLLADRFQLKMHFETRQLPVFELTPSKSGLKIKQVPTPNPSDPVPVATGGRPPLPAGMIMVMPGHHGGDSVSVHAITMSTFANFLGNSPEISHRPILDKTGFTGYFDITDFELGGSLNADSDAPSLSTALNENLGVKLTATKGPVEVLVIDSIERPSEN